jgi:hypothetical protein
MSLISFKLQGLRVARTSSPTQPRSDCGYDGYDPYRYASDCFCSCTLLVLEDCEELLLLLLFRSELDVFFVACWLIWQ